MHIEFRLEKKILGTPNFGDNFLHRMEAAGFKRKGFRVFKGEEKPGMDTMVLKTEDFVEKALENMDRYYSNQANELSSLYGWNVVSKEVRVE